MKELTIIGNIGKDPEKRTSKAGKDFYTFSVAAKTHSKAETEWVEIMANGDNKVMPYLQKGTKVLIRGSASVRAWLNKQGEPMATQCLSLEKVELLSSKSDLKPQAEATYEPMSMPTAGGGLQSDDIPF